MKKPKLRACAAGCSIVFGSMMKEGFVSFASCWGRPMTRKSVLDGLSDSKLADIQMETREKTDWSWLTEELKSEGEKEIKS